jgi:hypothetical protein
MQFPLGAMSANDILDRGLKMLFARLPTFYAINLIVMSPLLVLVMALIPTIFEADDTSEIMIRTITKMFLVIYAYPVLAGMLQPFATGAILYIVLQQIEGKRAKMPRAFVFAFSRFGTLLSASLLVGLLSGVTRLAACLPGKIVDSFYAFITHAVLFEKKSAGEAFKRSFGLGSKYFLHVLLVIFVIILADSVFFLFLIKGLQIFLPMIDEIPTANGLISRMNIHNLLLLVSLLLLADVLFRTYYAVCTTILYFDLRVRKEGFDLEMAARLEDEQTIPGVRRI